MKVKILKCSVDSYWYKENIGKIIEVEANVNRVDYIVKNGLFGVRKCVTSWPVSMSTSEHPRRE